MAKIKRKIVNIDEEKCDGCGLCITSCPEGALNIVDTPKGPNCTISKTCKSTYCSRLCSICIC